MDELAKKRGNTDGRINVIGAFFHLLASLVVWQAGTGGLLADDGNLVRVLLNDFA